MAKEHKDLVVIANTDRDGNAKVDAACKAKGCLTGEMLSIQYIPDNRLPYEPTVTFQFLGKDGRELFSAPEKDEHGNALEQIDGRRIWDDLSGNLNDEPVRIVVANGGKGKSGSFHIKVR